MRGKRAKILRKVAKIIYLKDPHADITERMVYKQLKKQHKRGN